MATRVKSLVSSNESPDTTATWKWESYQKVTTSMWLLRHFTSTKVRRPLGYTLLSFPYSGSIFPETELWHNGHDGVSNHQPQHCLLNRSFKRRSKKTSSFTSLAVVRVIHGWPVHSSHKGSITRELFPFDDVIMTAWYCIQYFNYWRRT